MVDLTPEQVIEAARGTTDGLEYCVLITQGESGWASARVMQHYGPEADLTIWFGTSPKTRKAREVTKDNRVAVAFQNDKEEAGATFLGTAHLIDDLDLRRKYWRQGWEAFWPEGPEGDDYVLIRFTPSRIEVFNARRGVAPQPIGLKAGAVVREGERWEVVEYE